MGKQGPCFHCGVTSTPLWRNGPREKPVLCNACGSRWRTKGTLANYAPLHARADVDGYKDHRVIRIKCNSVNRSNEGEVHKRKLMDEDVSNRSSSGSAISNSESCVQYGSADGSELTGPTQSIGWDSMVPSRRRTCVNRPKPSPVEKLTRDLFSIWHEQQSSCFSASSEEDLLFESETPMVSVEIGHGSVLFRHPSSIPRDEESEASSLSAGKQYFVSEGHAHCLIPPEKGMNGFVTPTPFVEKLKKPAGLGSQPEQLKRDQSQTEKIRVLEGQNSPLCDIDLNDILNFEEFGRSLTNQEQQQLLKYLPSSDTAQLPESIKSLFSSPQFKENISSYQQLLAEGVLDLSFSEAKMEECRTLKRLSLCNLLKSKWVAHYHLLKNCKNNPGRSSFGKGTSFVASNNLIGAKRSRDNQSQKVSEIKTMKTPRRNNINEHTNGERSCFSPRSLLATPTHIGSLMVDSLPFVDESHDQDLLVDVPSNGSFAQAELLLPTRNFGLQASASSSML